MARNRSPSVDPIADRNMHERGQREVVRLPGRSGAHRRTCAAWPRDARRGGRSAANRRDLQSTAIRIWSRSRAGDHGCGIRARGRSMTREENQTLDAKILQLDRNRAAQGYRFQTVAEMSAV